MKNTLNLYFSDSDKDRLKELGKLLENQGHTVRATNRPHAISLSEVIRVLMELEENRQKEKLTP